MRRDGGPVAIGIAFEPPPLPRDRRLRCVRTFSSFAYETVRLAEGGKTVATAVNAAGNLLDTFAAVALAWAATMAV